jgi:hypothetical protein
MQSNGDEVCLPDRAAETKRSKPKRNIQATDWNVELCLVRTNTPTRAEVYAALQGTCTSLLVCMEERRRVTLTMGVLVGEAAPLASLETIRLMDCHVCMRFDHSMTKKDVVELISSSLGERAETKSVSQIARWGAAIAEVSKTDLDAAIKDIDENMLDWRNRLWLRIVYNNVRTVRSLDPIFRELAARHVGTKSAFGDLLNRYQQQKNIGNLRRVNYNDCVDAKLVEVEINDGVVWAGRVLDWFAERLIPPEQNRRSLYLWGRAGVGKTRFVERLLEAQMCIHRDCSESFFLQGLSEDHQFAWLDEFVPETVVYNKEYRQQFNKLTGREHVMVRVKGGEQYEVDADNIRTIITSNHPPPTADYFLRRFFVVEAHDALYGSVEVLGGNTQDARLQRKRKQQLQLRNVGGHASKRGKCIGGEDSDDSC